MKILRSRVEAAFTGKGTAADVKTVTDAFAINKVEGLVVCDILLAQLAGQPFLFGSMNEECSLSFFLHVFYT